MNADDPIVEEVVRCEDLPPGSLAGRRMIVRWSDGTEGEAVRFYQDEVLSARATWSARPASRSGRCTSAATRTGFRASDARDDALAAGASVP